MCLLSLAAVVASLAAISQVARVWAYPSHTSTELVAKEEGYHQLEARAPPVPGSRTISLTRTSSYNT
jgi:hypothetical protein